MWEMEVDSTYYDSFVNGQKTIEGRKNKPDSWGRVRKGDTVLLKRASRKLRSAGSAIVSLDKIIFRTDRSLDASAPSDMMFFTVMETRTYESIEEYLQAETLERTLPGVSTVEEGVAIYLGFWGPEGTEEVAKHGIIAIELRPGRF